MPQFKREKRNISGWLILNKPCERCQKKLQTFSVRQRDKQKHRMAF